MAEKYSHFVRTSLPNQTVRHYLYNPQAFTCPLGMVHPQGADVGTASSVSVAANILNKQSWTADKEWSLGPGKVLTTHDFRYYETFHKGSDLE